MPMQGNFSYEQFQNFEPGNMGGMDSSGALEADDGDDSGGIIGSITLNAQQFPAGEIVQATFELPGDHPGAWAALVKSSTKHGPRSMDDSFISSLSSGSMSSYLRGVSLWTV